MNAPPNPTNSDSDLNEVCKDLIAHEIYNKAVKKVNITFGIFVTVTTLAFTILSIAGYQQKQTIEEITEKFDKEVKLAQAEIQSSKEKIKEDEQEIKRLTNIIEGKVGITDNILQSSQAEADYLNNFTREQLEKNSTNQTKFELINKSFAEKLEQDNSIIEDINNKQNENNNKLNTKIKEIEILEKRIEDTILNNAGLCRIFSVFQEEPYTFFPYELDIEIGDINGNDKIEYINMSDDQDNKLNVKNAILQQEFQFPEEGVNSRYTLTLVMIINNAGQDDDIAMFEVCKNSLDLN